MTIGKGTSDYQLNKRVESEPDYYKIERNGETLYRKFTTKTCELIPDEVDRLEYLITYCLKNYYIGRANKVARSSNEYVPKWYHEDKLEQQKQTTNEFYPYDLQVLVNGQRYKII